MTGNASTLAMIERCHRVVMGEPHYPHDLREWDDLAADATDLVECVREWQSAGEDLRKLCAEVKDLGLDGEEVRDCVLDLLGAAPDFMELHDHRAGLPREIARLRELVGDMFDAAIAT